MDLISNQYSFLFHISIDYRLKRRSSNPNQALDELKSYHTKVTDFVKSFREDKLDAIFDQFLSAINNSKRELVQTGNYFGSQL